MSDLISGQISFTGLGSGTDFNTIVDKLIEIEGTHKRSLEDWQATWEAKIEALQSLNTAMLSLKTTLGTMDTMNEFMSKEVSTSDSSILTALAESEAAEGTHSVDILQLAQNIVKVTTTGYASEKTDINPSSSTAVFAYQYAGGAEVTIDVPTDATLASLRNLINTDPDNPGVRASIITDGNNSYLQIRGLDMGDDASLVITSNTSLVGFSNASFETTQTNQDSKIKIDGWPTASNAWIETNSNTITGAIEGVTLNLKSGPAVAGTPETLTLTISTDTEGIKENVRTFVEQVNQVRALFRSVTKFNELEETGSIMTGNYAVQLVDSKMKVAMSDRGKGFLHFDPVSGLGDVYSALSQVGITTDAQKGSVTEGLLLLDEEVLADALAGNVDAVAELFAAEFIGGQSSSDFSYYSHIDGITKAGNYDVSYSVNASGHITNAYINGHAANVDNTEHTITAVASGQDEVGIIVKVNNLTAGNYTGSVRLKQGKTGEISDLLEQLTNSDTGPLNILEENYDDIIDNIQDKIDFEEIRLEKRSRELKLRFARLEALLGEYDGISTSLSNQIDQLDN